MKILLIGHSIIDHIEGVDKKTFPGGIFYSALGFLSAKKKNDEIFLLTGYNQKNIKLFESVYKKVNLDYSYQIDEMPEVVLKIIDDKEREEIYKNISSNLILDKVSDLNRFDGILINMITGFDISKEQLKQLRQRFSGSIYFDVHTLSRGIDHKMKRAFRLIPNVEEWLENVDLLQCNELELRTLYSSTDEHSIVDYVIKNGVKVVIVTRGEDEAEVFYMEREKLKSILRKPDKVKVVNRIGCGDIFGAVFFYNYLCHRNVENSLHQAVKISELAVSINIFENLDKFIND